jgi:hypothetical protein
VKVLFTFSQVLVEPPSPARFDVVVSMTTGRASSHSKDSVFIGDRSLCMRDATDSRAGYD